jgi:hypothetical protein
VVAESVEQAAATALRPSVDYEVRGQGAGVLFEGLDAQQLDTGIRTVANARDLVARLPPAPHRVAVLVGPAEA